MPQAVLGAGANTPYPLLLPTVLPHPPVNSKAEPCPASGPLHCCFPAQNVLPPTPGTAAPPMLQSQPTCNSSARVPASPPQGQRMALLLPWHGPQSVHLDLLVLTVPSLECLLMGCSWLDP